MTRKQKRIWAVALILLGAGSAAALSLSALQENVSFFYAPSDIIGPNAKTIPKDRPFRLGGLVKDGTVGHEGAVLHFTVTDNVQDIAVTYTGTPPDLFREGQGVIAVGKLGDDLTFTAQSLLAKHDEKYMPPEVAKALKKAAEEKGHPAQAPESNAYEASPEPAGAKDE